MRYSRSTRARRTGRSYDGRLNGQLDGQPGGFSGWLPIHPDFATQIHVTLAEPAIKPLDLYLATRLAAGQVAQRAQARWLEFVIDGFHETAI